MQDPCHVAWRRVASRRLVVNVLTSPSVPFAFVDARCVAMRRDASQETHTRYEIFNGIGNIGFAAVIRDADGIQLVATVVRDLKSVVCVATSNTHDTVNNATRLQFASSSSHRATAKPPLSSKPTQFIYPCGRDVAATSLD